MDYYASIFATMPDYLRALYLYSPNAQLDNVPFQIPDYLYTGTNPFGGR
jgi:hypothetical protein